MDKSDLVFRRFPQYAYDSDNKSSILYKLIKSITDEIDITVSNIDRIDKMIGIDTILPEDIYNRFGALLNINRNPGEDDDYYRNRLKVSVTSLAGGTASAIKYAIACGLGINNDANAMEAIHIYDAWDYDGDAQVIKDYGYIVCTVDLSRCVYPVNIESIISNSANNVKAAGTIIQFVYYNFRITYYTTLDDLTYVSLGTSTYSQVGE